MNHSIANKRSEGVGTVAVIADCRENSWHEQVMCDPIKNRMSENIRSSLELKLNGRYVDMIDLLNYSARRSLNGRDDLVDKHDFVSLNGIFLTDYLGRAGFEVHLVKDFSRDRGELQQLLEGDGIAAVVVSTTFMSLEKVKSIVAFVKQHRRGKVEIIIGGPTIFYAAQFFPQILEMYGPYLEGSFLVLEKQGERTLLELLSTMTAASGGGESGAGTVEVPNVIRVDSGGVLRRSILREENNNINDFIIDWGNLKESCLSRALSVRTSHGCPFHCDFCTFWVLHPRPMFKEMRHIAAELIALDKRPGVKHVMVSDETLNLTEERIRSFCDIFIKNNLSLQWSAFIRSKPMSPRIAEMMKASNCRFVYIGFESFEESILKNMRKKESVDDHLRCIEILKTAGIGVLGSFIFGFPGETPDTIERTVSLINRTGIDLTEIYCFIYYHYAPVAGRKDEFKLEGNVYDWRHATMNSRELYHSLLPAVVKQLKNFGLFNWDNWANAAVLLSHGFTIEQVREMYSLRHRMIDLQSAGAGISDQSSGGVPAADESLHRLGQIAESVFPLGLPGK